MMGCVERRWATCNPTKTGSQRLRRVLENAGLIEVFGPFHNATYEQAVGYGQRILIARDPLERWVSAYWFTRGLKQPMLPAEILGDPYTFMDAMADRTHGNVMACPLDTHVERWRPDIVIMAERIDELWPIVARDDEQAELLREDYWRRAPHSTKQRKSVAETFMGGPLSVKARSLIEAEAAALRSLRTPGMDAAQGELGL